MKWNEKTGEWELTASAKDFAHVKRMELPREARALLEAATEVHVKHGLKRGAEGRPEWERLRGALMDMAYAGFVAEEWQLQERFGSAVGEERDT